MKAARPGPRSRALLTRLALASVIVNVLIVVTGGAVRLTGSGLGCPTWPSCTDDSLTPTREYAVHGIIEFTNRQLTFVVSLVVLATLVVGAPGSGGRCDWRSCWPRASRPRPCSAASAC